MHNRINISFRDCLQLEIESDELKFDELKKEALELIEVVKGHLVDETEPDDHDIV